MSRLVSKNGSQRQSAQAPEDPVVRQYRYLLRTAPADALEAAHTEAIPLLSPAHQEHLLAALRSTLLVGDHVRTADHRKIAHLVTVGERRSPGVLLAALLADLRLNLAGLVLESEAAFGLLNGYAAWDGNDPAPPDDSAWADAGFTPRGSRLSAAANQGGFVPEGSGGG